MRGLVRRSVPLSCLHYLLDDWRFGQRLRRGRMASDSGTLHSTLTLDDSVAYIEEVVGDYLRYGGLDRFPARIAEVGPGDSPGVGLLMRAGGAESVDLVDRYWSRRDPAQQVRILQRVGERHPAAAALLGESFDPEELPCIRRWYGEEASAERFFLNHGCYDLIVSRAVMEHVWDPLGALEHMAKALRFGGRLLHKVDLRDHGMFSPHHSELTWFRTPSWLHVRMTRNSGRPNRVLMDDYQALVARLPLEATFLVTRLVGVGDITPHVPYTDIPADQRAQSLEVVRKALPGIAPELRQKRLETLTVAGFFLVASLRPDSLHAS